MGTEISLIQLASWARDIASIVTLLALFIKPLRDWLFGGKAVRDGQKCLLRSEIMRTYYQHTGDKTLRSYEYQNALFCYQAYKALKGNSFIDRIMTDMKKWNIKD